MDTIKIYTDGSSRGNPGPGGFGTILLTEKGSRKEISCGFTETTNNRMELLAAIAGLEALKRPCRVMLHSDSRYVVDALNKGWTRGWIKRGWRKTDKTPVKNPDLWKRLLAAAEPHDVTWRWVKGHAGHPENERCDELATAAADGESGPLREDSGYRPER